MRRAAAVLACALVTASPLPARAAGDVEGACAAFGVSNDTAGDRSTAVVALWVAAVTPPGAIGTFGTCTVRYGAGLERTFGIAAVGPAAATAVVLEDAAPGVRACATIGALWPDGSVVTEQPPCVWTSLEG